MATQAEKVELAAVAGLLSGVASVLRQQGPAIRDRLIQVRVERAIEVLAQAEQRIDKVVAG